MTDESLFGGTHVGQNLVAWCEELPVGGLRADTPQPDLEQVGRLVVQGLAFFGPLLGEVEQVIRHHPEPIWISTLAHPSSFRPLRSRGFQTSGRAGAKNPVGSGRASRDSSPRERSILVELE